MNRGFLTKSSPVQHMMLLTAKKPVKVKKNQAQPTQGNATQMKSQKKLASQSDEKMDSAATRWFAQNR